jgi:hypothetical protein
MKYKLGNTNENLQSILLDIATCSQPPLKNIIEPTAARQATACQIYNH